MLKPQMQPPSPAPMVQPLWVLGLLAFALAAVPLTTRAQASLEEREIVVEKSRTNELPPAGRNFEKLTVPPPPPVKREVKYQFRDFKLGDRPLSVNPRVAPLRQENAAPIPSLFIEGGFGNYGTPYGRFGAHTKPSDKYSAGLTARHQSSSSGAVDDKNSGGGNTAVTAEGELFSRRMAVGLRAGYELDATHFYGYDRTQKDFFKGKADSLRQTNSRINGEVTLRSTEVSSPFQADLTLGVRNWQSRFDEKETDAYGRFGLLFGLDPTNRFSVRGEGSFISYESVVKQNRPLGQATLAYEHDGERLDLSLGATAGYTGDTLNRAKQFNVYPAVRLSVEVIEDRLMLFGGAGGGLERTSRYQLSRQNPWLAKSMVEGMVLDTATGNLVPSKELGVALADVNRQLSVYGGLSGSPGSGARLLVRATYNLFRNLYFFNPRAVDSVRYELTYSDRPDRRNSGDQQVKNLNVHGEFSLDIGQKFQVGIKADVDSWSADSLRKAYHRPSFQGTLTSTFKLLDNKLQVSPEAYVIGATYGLGSYPAPGNPNLRALRQTDNVIDVNLRIDYAITPQFRIFALGQNLTGQKYQRFLNYPVRGATIIGGLSYQL